MTVTPPERIEGHAGAGAVEVTIDIEAPAADVYTHLVDPAKLLRWMGTAAELDARPGGSYRIELESGDAAVGSYVELSPPERIVMTWGWSGSEEVPPGSSTVTIELRERDGSTRLTLTHTGLPDGWDGEHLKGWLHFGGRLAIAAAGGDPDAG